MCGLIAAKIVLLVAQCSGLPAAPFCSVIAPAYPSPLPMPLLQSPLCPITAGRPQSRHSRHCRQGVLWISTINDIVYGNNNDNDSGSILRMGLT